MLLTQNNVLIIGYGYIGSALYESLKLDIRLNITVMDDNCDNENSLFFIENSIENFDEYYKFDIIILTAGQSSVKDSDNLDVVIHNNITNFSLILGKLSNKQKFIYMSSASVYGNTNGEIVNEMYTLKVPFNYYDMSKQTIDNMIHCRLKLPESPQIYGLRLGSVNGVSPKMRNDIIINSMVNNGLKNNLKIINQKKNRAILGMNDLTRAIHKIIYGLESNSGIYNLNSFNNSVGEIGETVRSKLSLENVKIDVEVKQDYDFKMTSKKFCDTFDFKFNDTLDSITSELIELKYKIVDSCKICKKVALLTLLNLGNQPLANNYKTSKDEPCYSFPLKVMLCNSCYHIQLNTVVNKDILFKDYIYLSGTSQTLKNYFKEFALYTLLRRQIFHNDNLKTIKILDIACNDGTQLDEFRNVIKKVGGIVEVITVGIDPAQNIYDNITSKKSEHDIYCEYFSLDTVKKLKKKYETFDIIIGQNVLGHVEYPDEFLFNCKELMNENSLLFIQTSQKDMIIENQFDTCYHEHQSFFCTNSMNELTKSCDLVLNNVMDNEIHGSSYIFEICSNNKNNSEVKQNVIETLNNEINNGLYKNETYLNYTKNCFKYRDNLISKLSKFKKDGKQIIGFGSTAKGQVILNSCGINSDYLDWIIDENPLKQNLYTANGILIKNIDSLNNISLENTIILIIAWNFEKEIKEKINLFDNFEIMSLNY